MDIKKYDLTVYTYNKETQKHEAEEVYLDSMVDVKAKIDSMKDDKSIRFMELYTYNAVCSCYDFAEICERPDRLTAGEVEEIADNLRALRAYCDVSATESKLDHNGEVADIFIRNVETLDTVLGLLEVLI